MRKGPGSSPTNKVDSIFPSNTGSCRHKSHMCFRLHSSVAASFPVSRCHSASGLMASSAAQDEIFRADKQLDPSKKTRNFSSFHTEQGGPIVHMSRPPTADVALHPGLRHSHADSGEC
jgi:hypothetical protein